jgi:ribonuclease P protein component
MLINSIKNQNEFDRAFECGKRYSGALLSAVVAKGEGPVALGIIVNKKFGNAVNRNRIKRQVRDAFRAIAKGFLVRSQIVVIPRSSARKAKTAEIKTELSSIAHNAGIL